MEKKQTSKLHRRRFIAQAGALGLVGLGGPAFGIGDQVFYVPAEEEPHALTFMQWPVSRQVYFSQGFLRQTQKTIANIANTISAFEPVVMLGAADHHAKMRKLLSSDVETWDVPTEDLWCRDSGPIFARNGAGDLAISQIQFNGWGNKQVHRHDARIAGKVAEIMDLEVMPTGLNGEGGGVDHDGYGLLIAHESSWVHRGRNPGMSRGEIERRLLAAYGAERVIWSPGVWDMDITDFHIDSLARFVGPGRVLVNLPDNPIVDDPFHAASLETHDHLVAAGLDVEVIPEPTKRRVQSVDFVASYANYYACNGAIIAAEFGDSETDRIAQDALARHYPGREIVSLNVDVLGELGGGIHCATQQMPLT